MLDDAIIGEILEIEKKLRKGSGWQPIPLYKELELPREDQQKKEKVPSGPIEIDIWGPEADDNVIHASSYIVSSRYYF